jgi:hypothetical protein
LFAAFIHSPSATPPAWGRWRRTGFSPVKNRPALYNIETLIPGGAQSEGPDEKQAKYQGNNRWIREFCTFLTLLSNIKGLVNQEQVANFQYGTLAALLVRSPMSYPQAHFPILIFTKSSASAHEIKRQDVLKYVNAIAALRAAEGRLCNIA